MSCWSEITKCPDCHQQTLRVFWAQRDGEAPKRVDEFCDNPGCTRGN